MINKAKKLKDILCSFKKIIENQKHLFRSPISKIAIGIFLLSVIWNLITQLFWMVLGGIAVYYMIKNRKKIKNLFAELF